MTHRNLLLSAAVATALALTTAPLTAVGQGSSKPAGATGAGQMAHGQARSNQFWWPDQLDLSPLRDQDSRSQRILTRAE